MKRIHSGIYVAGMQGHVCRVGRVETYCLVCGCRDLKVKRSVRESKDVLETVEIQFNSGTSPLPVSGLDI